MIPEYFSQDEFMIYDSETGQWKFLKGRVVHDGFEQFSRKVAEVDGRGCFKPIPAVEKPKQCSVTSCTHPPCQSFLSNNFCPEHYARKARHLLIPDTDTPEEYLGRPLLGSEVVIRLSPKNHSKKYPLLQEMILKFRKGKLYISIDKTDQIVNEWRYYAENGEAIFEIFDNIHYNKVILSGDYKARLQGQPICENLLKGKPCKSTTDFDPHQDSLPELMASSEEKGTFGLPGVFPKRDKKDQLTIGTKCYRCSKEKPEPPKMKPVKETKSFSNEDMKEQLIQSLQQQLELMKQLQDRQIEMNKQLVTELRQKEKELSKAIAAKSDLEERLRKTN